MTTTKPQSEVEELLGQEFHPERAIDAKKLNLKEEMLLLNRVSKVVKGGRRFSFAALVAVGDANGHVGLGFGKANEVPDSIQKAAERARKNIIRVPLMGRTIPHQVIGVHDSARILLKPASEGTGLIAGSAVRKYLALAGIHDILAKSLGSDNILNVIKATLVGLQSLKRADEIARLRGKKIESLIGRRGAEIYLKSKASTLAAEDPELARRLAAAAKAPPVEESRTLSDTVPAEEPPAQSASEPTHPPAAGAPASSAESTPPSPPPIS